MNIYHHHTIRFVEASSNPSDSADRVDTSPSDAQKAAKRFERIWVLLHLATLLVGPLLGNRTSKQSGGKDNAAPVVPPAVEPVACRDERSENSSAKPTNNLIAELFLQAHESTIQKNATDARPLA